MQSRLLRLLRMGFFIAIALGGIAVAVVVANNSAPVHVLHRPQPAEVIGGPVPPSGFVAATPVPGSLYECVMTYESNPVSGDAFRPHGGGTLRVNGFTIEIRADTDPAGPNGMTCHVSIRSPKGEIIYEGDNDGIDVDLVTGKDVNGDGEPDAVVVYDLGSAHHDVYGYSIISLGQKPGLIRQVEGIAEFRNLKGDGQMETLVGLPAAFQGFHGLSNVDSPSALLILRLQGSKFEDVGSEFTNIYDQSVKEDLSDLKDRNISVAHDPDEQRSVLSIVLDYLFSGRPKEARKTLDQFWPEDDRESVRKDIIEEYCGGDRERLGVATDSTCMGGDF